MIYSKAAFVGLLQYLCTQDELRNLEAEKKQMHEQLEQDQKRLSQISEQAELMNKVPSPSSQVMALFDS